MSHFVAALDGRIRSMATAHELLSTRQWQGMPMAALVRRELAAYASSDNTKIDGPEVMLSAEAGQAMAMVIHELVTNAQNTAHFPPSQVACWCGGTEG
jgi:two-component sensor histidine kinase